MSGKFTLAKDSINMVIERIFRAVFFRCAMLRPIVKLAVGGSRRLAVLNPVSKRDNNDAIPKVVFQTFETNSFSVKFIDQLTKIKNRNGEYDFVFYDASRRDDFVDQYWGGSEIQQVYHWCPDGVMKADIWGLLVLYIFGGYYFDLNKFPSVPLNNLVDPKIKALVSTERFSHHLGCPPKVAKSLRFSDKLFGMWGFAFEAGHPLIAVAIEEIILAYRCRGDLNFDNFERYAHYITGPISFTRACYKFLDSDEYDPDTLKITGPEFDGSLSLMIPWSWSMRFHVPHYKKARLLSEIKSL